MDDDAFDLGRFLEAQQHAYDEALDELRDGSKQGHWIWYVFPQLRGLGLSPMSERYGLSGVAEARAYLAHPVLGQRLRECIEAMLAHRGASAESILGQLDALKFRSCLTLFAQAGHVPVVATALQQFFAGRQDARTLQLLDARGDAAGPDDQQPDRAR
jgi:uncharacterized protein (DUF1810 family)